MKRDSLVWWYVILGAVLWWAGTWWARSADIGSWSQQIAAVVSTLGLVVVGTVIVSGMWRSLKP